MNEYRLLRVYADNELMGEPVAKASTLQAEIDAIFGAAIADADLHGKRIEVQVYDQYEEDRLDTQTADAHDWTGLDLRPGHRQVCKTCGALRKN